MKQIKFEDLSQGTQTGIILVLAISLALLIINFMPNEDILDLQNQIDSMPHYECYNESINKFVNMNETSGFCIGDREKEIWHCNYEGYDAECVFESMLCYVNDIKEVCELK